MTDPEVRLRRLRAALGASAAVLGSSGVDLAALLTREVQFAERIIALAEEDGATAQQRVIDLWRELRTRTTALAADLPATDAAIALLQEQLAVDGDQSRDAGD